MHLNPHMLTFAYHRFISAHLSHLAYDVFSNTSGELSSRLMSFPAARKRRSRGDEFSRDANIYFTNIYFCSRNAIRGINCGAEYFIDEYFNISPGALTRRSMREPPYLPKGARWRKRLAENLCEPLPSGRTGRKADIRGVRGTKFSGIPEGWWDFQTRDLPRARNFRSYSIGSIGMARYRYVDRAGFSDRPFRQSLHPLDLRVPLYTYRCTDRHGNLRVATIEVTAITVYFTIIPFRSKGFYTREHLVECLRRDAQPPQLEMKESRGSFHAPSLRPGSRRQSLFLSLYFSFSRIRISGGAFLKYRL